MSNPKRDRLPPTILQNFWHLVLDVFEVFVTLVEEMGRGFGWRRRKHRGAKKPQ